MIDSTSATAARLDGANLRPLRGAADVWSIELLRGIAALLVVAVHYQSLVGVDAGLLRFAFTGVDLFFVISGFVFAPYLFGKALRPVPHLVRRFFRLYPLYLVALLAYAGLSWTQGQGLEQLPKHLLLLHTWQTREIAFHYNPAFWSLPPEVEFYLALPLLALVVRRIEAVLALTAIALALHLMLAFASPIDAAAVNTAWRLSFHLPGLLVEFMVGALAWWGVGRGPSLAMRCGCITAGAVAWLVLALLFVALSARGGDSGVNQSDALRGNVGMWAAGAYALIVTAWVGWITHPPAWLAGLARALGRLSYGVYLFHNLMPELFKPMRAGLGGVAFAALCLAATLVVSALLNWSWERPWREWGRSLAARMSAARVNATSHAH